MPERHSQRKQKLDPHHPLDLENKPWEDWKGYIGEHTNDEPEWTNFNIGDPEVTNEHPDQETQPNKGIEVNRTMVDVSIKQSAYASKILKEAGMIDCNKTLIPMDPGTRLTKITEGTMVNSTKYRSLIGCLRYMLHTRPDLSYSVGLLSRFMQEHKKQHMSNRQVLPSVASDASPSVNTQEEKDTTAYYSFYVLRGRIIAGKQSVSQNFPHEGVPTAPPWSRIHLRPLTTAISSAPLSASSPSNLKVLEPHSWRLSQTVLSPVHQVFTVNLHHDRIFTPTSLRYVQGDEKQITNINFKGMSYVQFHDIIRHLVHGIVHRLYYCPIKTPLNVGIKELKTDNDVDEFSRVVYEQKWFIDLYVEHFDYDVLDFINEEANRVLSSGSSDEYYSNDECEKLEEVDFQTEGRRM
ncbi:ribonuclease H-like domain, reverse transcriptase, RNA-dependent DNA polymerase [Tanacetum coccineum]